MARKKTPAGSKPDQQSCWFESSSTNVRLVGQIWSREKESTAPIQEVVVIGKTSTPFVVQPGRYRYEFNIVGGEKFTLQLYVHGEANQNTPKKFDPADGTIARVTRFAVA